MRIKRQSGLLPNERFAGIVFSLLLVTSFIEAAAYRSLWIFGAAMILLIWAFAIGVAIIKCSLALRDPDLRGSIKVRAAAAMPLAVIAALVVGRLIGPPVEASIYLAFHLDDMHRAQIAAGPNRPAAIHYVEGIPDGGVAIIRSRIPPNELESDEQVRLAGEDIHRCYRIVPDAWACGFD